MAMQRMCTLQILVLIGQRNRGSVGELCLVRRNLVGRVWERARGEEGEG